jgi:tRNA pseudouridine55 synthase
LIDGLAVVDKRPGWTSHDVVAVARGRLGERRVGHAGTLDPPATGVLLLGVGRVTRLLRFVGALPKRYVAEMVLGVETSTLDAEGDVVASHDMSAVTPEDVGAAAMRFVGHIEQVPPMVSAVKVGGQRLHALARQGIEVERAPRPVDVHAIDVEATRDPLLYRLDVRCSSGTYVRTLAADIGNALGGGAHLRALRRTEIGRFRVEDACDVEELTVSHLLPSSAAVSHLASIEVDDDLAAAIANGAVLERAALGVDGEGPWAVHAASGNLLAVYEPRGDERVKPAVVLASNA